MRAIAHTFTIAADGKPLALQRAPNAGETGDIQPASDAERNAILANATPIMIAGQRRLQLSDEARGDLLERVRGSELYVRLLSSTAEADRRASRRSARATSAYRAHGYEVS